MKSLNILLVEDHLLNQRVMSLFLKKANHKVTIANNGQEAVEFFRQNDYDLILMDLMMPVMDGYEATSQIRIIEKDKANSVPIIAVTANTMDNDRQKCIESGMNGYVVKPFDIDSLNDILNSLFGN